MAYTTKHALARKLAVGVAALALLPELALAQEAASPPAQAAEPDLQSAEVEQQGAGGVANISSENPAGDEIVVTGTLLRGAAPVGSNLISVGSERLQEQGATTSNELLATIPQVSNLFNNVPSANIASTPNVIQVVRPDLRNLSGATSSSASTLVLVDGHRIAGVGVTQSAVDPDLIPAGAIERVEVVTDGGSATYGADAVGGVINFITRKSFDGLLVDARYGFADDYYQVTGSATAGKDWGSGSLFASYTYQRNDALFGRDRDFIRQIDFNTGVPVSRRCAPGTVTLPGAFDFETFTFGPSVDYALPALSTPGTFNACDISDDQVFVPSSERHGVMIGLHQELSDTITMDLRTFYGERTSRSTQPLRGEVALPATNAFYRPIPGSATATQTVSFTLAPVLGTESAPSGTAFDEWGASAEFQVQLGGGFQLRQLFNYSTSKSDYFLVELNQPRLAAAASSADPQGAVNFYNPAATPNLALISGIADNEIAGQGRNELLNVRTIVDGTLFTLPGGEVRLAAGYEFIGDRFKQRVAPANSVRGAVRNEFYSPYNRDVHAGFGELQVPIFGEGNRVGGLYALTVSGSVRFDHFSDFGGTTNPKIAVTYKPVQWFALRGNYSTSFNAPSAVDQLGALRNTINFFPFNPFVRPGDVPNVVGAVGLQGSTPNLQPQTARTYSFGADLDLPFLTKFHASANYYNVRFNDLLTQPTPNPSIFTNFPDNVQTNINGVSVEQLRAFGLLAPGGTAVVEQLIAANRGVYELIDFRIGNFGTLSVDGIDFTANYRFDTSFGGFDMSASGNYTLNRSQRVGPGAVDTDLLMAGNNTSRLQLQATLGMDAGGFRAQATLNHSSGFDVVRAANLPQDRVRDFNTVNLFFKYDVPSSSGVLRDLSFTANVNNLFDVGSPVYRETGSFGYVSTYGFTLGRLVQFGVTKSF